MIKIAICDDSNESIELINNKTIEIAKEQNRSVETVLYKDGTEIVETISQNPEMFDILLLDIDMPKISGIEVANRIRQTKSEVLLIFISAHSQYVFEAIEYAPFRYIRKERLEQEFPFALEAAFRVVDSNQDTSTCIKTDDGEAFVKHSSIMYFESQSYQHKISIYLSNGTTLVTRNSIKNLYAELNDENFIKIHSGCVVNAKYIRSFAAMDITLDNGQKLIISRTRMKEVKSTLLKYWGKKI